jgi:hypothetical protein
MLIKRKKEKSQGHPFQEIRTQMGRAWRAVRMGQGKCQSGKGTLSQSQNPQWELSVLLAPQNLQWASPGPSLKDSILEMALPWETWCHKRTLHQGLQIPDHPTERPSSCHAKLFSLSSQLFRASLLPVTWRLWVSWHWKKASNMKDRTKAHIRKKELKNKGACQR